MTTTNDITGDKIKSKPSTRAWYEASYWGILDDKLREKDEEAIRSFQQYLKDEAELPDDFDREFRAPARDMNTNLDET